MEKFFITTTLPYVNAEPHVGFAMEIVRADVLARIHKLMGDEVFFNTGTDEHGQKIYQKALELGKDPQEYCDELAAEFLKLKDALDLSYNSFIRTTDRKHVEAAKEFWKRCEKSGDIYKKKYQAKYCVGCELEKTDSELIDGRCPIHPNKDLELIEEENYFFRFSKYQEKLLGLYKEKQDFVVPSFRQKEIENFVKGGLQDFSISRVKEKMPWGIPVPGDETQVMYVWFDALINYVSCLGWPNEKEMYEQFWPGYQICGKDNLRQQSAMWQSMLMSAGLPNSKQILINGFIMANGQKMSKSLGNVVNPFEYIDRYGTDPLRYYLLAKLATFEDGDFTKERFEEVYQSDLANGIGNLCSRVAAMAEKENIEIKEKLPKVLSKEVVELTTKYEFNEVMQFIWQGIKKADSLINEREVWKMEDREKKEILITLVNRLYQIGVDLQPFLPETAEMIMDKFGLGKIEKGNNLFPRL